MKSKIGDRKYGVRKAKEYYTSLPKWLPVSFRDYIEDRLWWVSKRHDNDCGMNGTGWLITAHFRFIKGVLLKSELPILFRPIFAIIAFPVIVYAGHGEWRKPQ